MNKLFTLFKALCLAGFILLLIGMYFLFIGAGIPYQDPTTEMAIQWTASYLAGQYCMKCGGIAFLVGLLGAAIFERLLRAK